MEDGSSSSAADRSRAPAAWSPRLMCADARLCSSMALVASASMASLKWRTAAKYSERENAASPARSAAAASSAAARVTACGRGQRQKHGAKATTAFRACVTHGAAQLMHDAVQDGAKGGHWYRPLDSRRAVHARHNARPSVLNMPDRSAVPSVLSEN